MSRLQTGRKAQVRGAQRREGGNRGGSSRIARHLLPDHVRVHTRVELAMEAHQGGCTMTETLARHLVDGLARHGVDRVFAIPGVHNTELFRGLTESGIAVVLPRHEQSAGFMADGFARATGRPGVCFVVTGPGLTNVLTAFGEAWSDSVPVLVVSTDLARRNVAKGRGESHEMMDQAGAARSFGALSLTIEDRGRGRRAAGEGVHDVPGPASAAGAPPACP